MFFVRRRLTVLTVLLGLAGCGQEIDPQSLPTASATLREVGKRLGKTLSPDAMTAIGETESTLLNALTKSERASLGRAYLRFQVDRPCVVSVVIPGGREPFWLADQRFQPDGQIEYPDGRFRVWSRRFDAGMVGLGVNSLDRRAKGHYMVFVRGQASTPLLTLTQDLHEWTVREPAKELAPYSDDARLFQDVPDELRTAIAIQPRQDWRHDSSLIRGKVWKTRLPSSPTPDQVVVSFGSDPSESLSWTWRTDPSVVSSELKLERLDGSGSAFAKGEYVEVGSDGLLNDPIIHRHRITVTGLETDSLYRYAIYDQARKGWTAWKTVRTAPTSDRDYSFLAMGDPQCGLEDWGRLLHVAHDRHPQAGFLLIAGDLVDRGNERSNWDHFFMRATGVFDVLPLMPCVGNHEYLDKGPDIFAKSFALPANGPPDIPHRLTYSFEYSDTFVAVLDSNPAVYSKDKAQIQAKWLDEALSHTKARWKLVVFHHPIYPSHPKREQPQLAEAWVPVLDRNRVDLVLQGHDHAYLRTFPMHANHPVTSTDEQGTTYVVSVSGQKFVPLAERAYTAKGFADVATYQVIEISPRQGILTYRALDVEGQERDRLELTKPQPAAIARSSTVKAGK